MNRRLMASCQVSSLWKVKAKALLWFLATLCGSHTDMFWYDKIPIFGVRLQKARIRLMSRRSQHKWMDQNYSSASDGCLLGLGIGMFTPRVNQPPALCHVIQAVFARGFGRALHSRSSQMQGCQQNIVSHFKWLNLVSRNVISCLHWPHWRYFFKITFLQKLSFTLGKIKPY